MKLISTILFVLFAVLALVAMIIANINGRPFKAEKIAIASFCALTAIFGYLAFIADIG